jgi:hypothetical protein
MNKKTIIIISYVLVVILAMTGATYALLSTESQAKVNSFVPGVLTTTIIENNEDSDNTEILTPDEDVTSKIVEVLNVNNPHEVDAYIRVMLVPTFRTNEGTLAGNMSLDPSSNIVTITSPDDGTITLHLIDGWDSNWIFDNGYFYHIDIVQPGIKTAILLESVEVSDIDLWSSFQLEVLSDAIQAEGGAAEDAWGQALANQLEQP